MIKKLSGSIREYKLQTILSPLFMIGEAIMETLMPFILAKLVNEIQAGCGIDTIMSYGAVLVTMAFVSLAFGGFGGFVASKASAGFAKNLRYDIFSRIQQFSFENIDKFSSSSLVTRMTTDISNVQMAYMVIIRLAIRAPLMMIFAIIMAAYMGGKLSVMFVVILPILTAGLILIGYKALPSFKKVFKKYDKLNESIEENVMAMRAVKAFNRESYEKNKFEKASDDICKDFTRAERIISCTAPLFQTCVYSVMAVVLVLGSKIIIETTGLAMNVGQLSSMVTYGFQILISLNMLSMVYVMITMSSESAHRIAEVLDEMPTLHNPEKPVYEVKDGSIDFDSVSFKYNKQAKKYALSDVDLHIKSGETVGVIGSTGSAKTTLVQLIPRLYDVTEGELKVGGINVMDYDLDSLRNQVAVVLQKNLLFSGTIKDNLRWGNNNATDEEIANACKLACADEFISNFPEGYDTWIEQGGTNVSGGQKQRLCIARALLKNPKILILDDSTSAVDMKTDAIIRESFKKYIPETTKIIIAQRIASVMDADKIVIMNSGKIEAVGTHEELLKSNKIYRETYEQQTNGGDVDE
ncbi:MAG: ABC transporter ATP-binding protein/permease [Clostridiales bacterium]|nr:ABC transporter ATP-binding protein/permease [Clostridiales bacterium]